MDLDGDSFANHALLEKQYDGSISSGEFSPKQSTWSVLSTILSTKLLCGIFLLNLVGVLIVVATVLMRPSGNECGSQTDQLLGNSMLFYPPPNKQNNVWMLTLAVSWKNVVFNSDLRFIDADSLADDASNVWKDIYPNMTFPKPALCTATLLTTV